MLGPYISFSSMITSITFIRTIIFLSWYHIQLRVLTLYHHQVISIYCAAVLSTVFCYFRFIIFISCCWWLFYHHDSILYNSNSISDHFLWFLLFNLIDLVTIPPWTGLTKSVLAVSLRNLLSTKLAIFNLHQT